MPALGAVVLTERLLQPHERVELPSGRDHRTRVSERPHDTVDVLELAKSRPALVLCGPHRVWLEPHREGFSEVLIRMTLSIPVAKVLHEAVAVRFRRIVLGIFNRRVAEEPAT